MTDAVLGPRGLMPQASAGSELTRPKDAADAARQFEGLLVGELMKSMRECSSGWLGTGEDGAGMRALEFAEQSLAQTLASQGGLGLSAMIARGLETDQKSVAKLPGAASPDERFAPPGRSVSLKDE